MELLQSVFDQTSLKAEDIPSLRGVTLVGTIDVNIQSKQQFWSDDLYHFLGLKPGVVISNHELFLSHVLEEDRAQLRATIEERYDGLGGEKYKFYKIRTGNGTISSVMSVAEEMNGESGYPENIFIKIFEVSKVVGSNHLKDNLGDHLSFKWLNRVFENKVAGIFILNDKGQFLRTNTTFQKWSGYSAEELKHLTFLDLTPMEEKESYQKEIDKLVTGKSNSYVLEKQLLTKSGELRWVEVHGSVIDEESFYVLGYLTDIHEKKITRKKFQTSEDQLYEAQKIAKIGSWEVDLKTLNITWSRGMFDLMEVAHDFIPDVESILQFIHPDDLDMFQSKVSANEELKDFEVRHVTKSGVKHLLINSKLDLDENGAPKLYHGTSQDVTDRFISSKRLQLVQETSKLGWWETDLISNDSKWSDSVFELFGLDKATTKQSFKTFLETAHPDDHEKVLAIKNDRNVQINGWHNMESKHKGPDGTYHYLATSGQYIWDGDKPVKLIGTMMDISDLKEIQIRLEEAQQIANIGWWEVNLMSGESKWSDTTIDILEENKRSNTLTFSGFADGVHQDDQEWFYTDLINNKEGWVNKEIRYKRKKGGYKHIVTSGRVFFDEDNPVRLVGTIMDISSLKETQIKLEQAQKLAKVGWWEFDLTGEENNWYSPEHMRIMGIENLDELKTFEDFYEFIHPDDRDRVKEAQRNGFENGGWSNMVHRIITKTGEVKHITSDATIETVDGEPLRLFGTVYDITYLKEIEQKLSGNLVNLEAMVKSMDNIVLLINEDLRYQEVFCNNPALLGTRVDKLVGKSLSDNLDEVHVRQILKTKGIPKETLIRSFKAALNGKPIDPFSFEYIYNEHKFWLEAKFHPFKGQDGSKWLAITVNDITARKNAEEELIKSVQKEKELSELQSQFVSMASHQFRTPLTVIKANMQLLELSRLQSPVIDKVTNRLNKEVDRLVNLMEDIMAMGKVQSKHFEPNLKPVNLISILKKIKLEVERQQKDQRTLNISIEGEERYLDLDEQFIEHALHNLIDNAFKYSPKAANPEVKLQFCDEKVGIRVTDYGIGIPKKDQDSLFNSFQRGSNSQHIQGTGLGLAVAKEFVRLNNGTIYLSKETKEGTEFCIDLPAKLKKS